MRRLLQTLRLTPCARVVPRFIEPFLAQARIHLKTGDFALLESQLAQLPAESYEHFVWRLADDRQTPGWLKTWSRAMPQSPHPALLSAYVDISNAWKVRGETYARDIPFLRRRRFPKIMNQAYEKFLGIIETDPGNPMALAGLIHCNVVIGAGDGHRDQWMHAAMLAQPFHCPVIVQYARGTYARWGGEVDEHYQFAAWVVENAPAGSCSLVIAAQAVLDDALSASEEIDDIRQIAQHLRDEDAAAWLRQATLKWAGATPETLQRRIGSIIATHGDDYHVVCLESFALAAYFCGATNEARLLFTALRGRLQAEFWEYYIPPLPIWMHMIRSGSRGVCRVHDQVCRDLGLDPRQVCQ